MQDFTIIPNIRLTPACKGSVQKAPVDNVFRISVKIEGIRREKVSGKDEPDRTRALLKVNLIYLLSRCWFGTGSLGVGNINLIN